MYVPVCVASTPVRSALKDKLDLSVPIFPRCYPETDCFGNRVENGMGTANIQIQGYSRFALGNAVPDVKTELPACKACAVV